MDLKIGKSEKRALGKCSKRSPDERSDIRVFIFSRPPLMRATCYLLKVLGEDFRMKLPHTPACVMSLTILATILAATIALPAPARAQTYDPSYPVCLLPEHLGFLLRVPLSNDGAVCGVGLGPLRAMRGQSIFRRAEGQAQEASAAVLKIGSLRRPDGPA